MTVETDRLYDLRGLKCPLPVLKTRKRMSTMQIGEELVVETTDPLAGFASVTANLVVSFYFAKRGFENVARIIRR